MTAKKTTIASATAIALALTGGTAFAATSSNDASSNSGSSNATAQGLYSAEQLMDASVYAQGNSKKKIGELEDVLLGNNMSVEKFVIETEGKLDLGGKSYVVSPSDVEVQTMSSKHASKPKYKVTLNMSKSELEQQPVYSDAWYSSAQSQAQQAWENTKQSAQSAWTQIKSTTSNVVNGAQDQASDAKQATSNAADNATDKASNAADNAGDAVSNAASNTKQAASNAANDTQQAASNAASDTKQAAQNAASNTKQAAQNATNNN